MGRFRVRPAASLLGSLAVGAGLLVPLMSDHAAAAVTINVPAEQPTIQAGINAATNGDTVLVAPGAYYEHITFQGKAIEVRSSFGPDSTVISGAGSGTAVTFNSGEGSSSVLRGFTVRDSSTGVLAVNASPMIVSNLVTRNLGHAIDVAGGAATIESNEVIDNVGCAETGIRVSGNSATIRLNHVMGNHPTTCSSGNPGGGIHVGAATGTLIEKYLIEQNTQSFGAGIGLNATSNVVIRDNVIRYNMAGNDGGGIETINTGGGTIVQNVIYGNTASSGGGIELSAGSPGFLVASNTIIGNVGGGLLFDGGINCTAASAPVLSHNNASTYLGSCSGVEGSGGNISAAPQFVHAAAGDFRLVTGSPSIDAGDNSAPSLPALDIAGTTRILNGTVDQGAFEGGYDAFVEPRRLPPALNSCTSDCSPRRPYDFGASGSGAASGATAWGEGGTTVARSSSLPGLPPRGVPVAPPAAAVPADPRFTG